MSGSTFEFKIPNHLVGRDVNAWEYTIMATATAPGGSVSGGTDGTKIENQMLRPIGGTGRWYDGSNINTTIASAGDVTNSTHWYQQYVYASNYIQFEVTDDRAEDIDVVLEVVVAKAAN